MDSQTTIHGWFEKQVLSTPYSSAVLYGTHGLTYEELNKKANQLAHYLLSKGIKPDTPVAFCMERSVECMVTVLGILKAGAAYLPLDPEHPEERLLFILNDSAATCLITQSQHKALFKHYSQTTLFLDSLSEIIETCPKSNPNLLIEPHQLAYVIYTSGSTGKPKGVLIEHQSVVNYVRWFADYALVKPKERIDFASNHTFDMAITVSIAPLMLGMTVVICDNETKKNLRHYLNYLKTSKIAIIKTTPSFFKVLLQEIKNRFIALPYLKTIILGGENLSSSECKAWLKYYPAHTLYNEYGPTETTVAVTQYRICAKNAARLTPNVPIGHIGDNMEFMILDANQHPVAPEHIGELYVGGICLARGYLNQPELTQKHFISYSDAEGKSIRLYKTGDLCVLQKNGVLEYMGRCDSQLKIRGYRIEPSEIENHLLAYPAICEAVVTRAITRSQDADNDKLVAYYIVKNNATAPTFMDLREYLLKCIPDFMVPSAFIRIDSFPLTANGKLDYALLPIHESNPVTRYTAPSSSIEKRVAKIWSQELDIKTIGLHDDFYELGGHSLSAARIISKINRTLGTDVTLHDFYFATNIAQLCHIIKKSKKRKLPKFTKNSRLTYDDSQIPLSEFQFMLWISNTFESKAKKLNITARKRLDGNLDKSALRLAFNAVLKKQETLFYRVLKLKPIQLLQKKLDFKITETDLISLPEETQELMLQESMKALMNFYPWPKNSPLILAKLFHLSPDEIELQIALPHIICDDFSPEIVLSNVSEFYLQYKKQRHTALAKSTKPNDAYKEYITNEQDITQKNLERDMQFWDNYMADAGLLTIHSDHIVKNMNQHQLRYSTYEAIPESTLQQFKLWCTQNHVSLNEGLSAAVGLALAHACDGAVQKTPYIYVNLIKSTRNSELYDDTVGCFLRLEPIKFALDKTHSLEHLIQQIRQSSLETSFYQQCPDLVKLSSISTFRQETKIIKAFALNVFSALYAALFSWSEHNKKIFKRCSTRLSTFSREDQFIININVQKKFIGGAKIPGSDLFGLATKNITSYQHDLLQINNVLDICFLRDENNDMPYLVLSANLNPEFRSILTQKVIEILKKAPYSTCINSIQSNTVF